MSASPFSKSALGLVLRAIVKAWLIIQLLAIVGQRYFIFPTFVAGALAGSGMPPADLAMRVVTLDNGVNPPVQGWFFPAPGIVGPAPVVLFAHGNGETKAWAPERLRPYLAMGISVLVGEYRGYGGAGGEATEASLTEDFVAFYDQAVRQPEVDRARVVIHGRSIGGGVACALAARRPPAALILQSTFTSLAAVAVQHGVLPALVHDRFDNAATVAALGRPTLLLHGRHDWVVPFSHSQELASIPGTTLVAFDAGHNDFPMRSPQVWMEIEAFLRSAGVLPSL